MMALLTMGILAVSFTSPAIALSASLYGCLTNASVPTLSNGTSAYTQALKPFNLRVPFTPAAYVVPTNVQHIQNAIICGGRSGVRVTAKSGGHSYGSHGLGGEDGHLIVDMQNFSNVTVDQAAHIATIGTGGRLGDIATSLYAQGKQAVPHGTCPGVGLGGLSLHGGYGMMSRLRGLTLDSILEAEVVLSNGSIMTASNGQNSELFYALRGAGAAFGIVTNLKMKTFDAPESNIVFSYFMNFASTNALASFLASLQDFTRHQQPPELNMRLFLMSFGATFSGVYYGPRGDFETLIAPLLAPYSINIASGASTKSWTDSLLAFSNGPLAQKKPYDTHETFYAKSLMPEWLGNNSLVALSQYWYTTARSNSRSWYLLIDCHGGNGSAITSIPANSTAYAHRNATFKMQFYDRVDSGSYDPSWQSFLNGWVDSITTASSGVNFGMYINYADTNLSSSQAHSHYWLSHYDHLVTLKQRYDPRGLFSGPQLVDGVRTIAG